MDKIKIQEAVKVIIDAVGEDANREGLKDTPLRISKMYEEIFKGLNEDPKDHLSKTFTVDNDNLVIEKDIHFYSMCEHHFLPFFGKAHIAYIPNGKVVGLSKLARTVEVFARRPQLQERLTEQIGNALLDNLDCKGVMVVVEAEHLCMSMRGIKKPGSKTVSMFIKGSLEKDINMQNHILTLIK